MKKTVLLTNDDGIAAKGLELLYNVLRPEYNVIIVAPQIEQSGVGHSFTFHQTLFLTRHTDGFAENLYSLTGSPADCVKFAISQLLPKYPDLIISGLNYGENSGISSYYSGTVAGAREGAFWRIRSFAFSLSSEAQKYAEEYVTFVPEIIRCIDDPTVVSDEKVYFNINFPPVAPETINGIKFTRQSMAYFQDSYESVTSDADEGYRIIGEKVNIETSNEYDSRALLDKYITVTPHSFDSTSYEYYTALKKLEGVFSIKGEYYD
jgi:5'-nucleotidase